MKVKVAAIQMSADIGGREANVERAERLLIQAARQGADLCVLPELALDEFFPLYKDTRYFAYAEDNGRSSPGAQGCLWEIGRAHV